MKTYFVDRPELVIGLVGPAGGGVEELEHEVRDVLRSQKFGYECGDIHLSEFMFQLPEPLWNEVQRVWASEPAPPREEVWRLPDREGASFAERVRNAAPHIAIRGKIEMGGVLRRSCREILKNQAGEDVIALFAIEEIRRRRETRVENTRPVATVLRSLKHPLEIETLRSVYGPCFFLIGTHAPDERRRARMLRTLEGGIRVNGTVPAGYSESDMDTVVDYLLRRDSYDSDAGQRVRDCYYRADLFVPDTPDEMRGELRRFFSLVFGESRITPRRDEHAMAMAHLVAVRSGAAARQVGAVVVEPRGEVIASGCNELARPGGGLVFEGDSNANARDIAQGSDTGDKERLALLQELLEALRRFLKEKGEGLGQHPEGLEVTWELVAHLRPAGLLKLIEFYREVHAEAAALMDAARRGVRTEFASVFVTTFPCHDCAKHLIAAGIKRVVFLEPYPKSKAKDFFRYAIAVTPEGKACGEDQRIVIEAFRGVGPRLYKDLFSLVRFDGSSLQRKDGRGSIPEPEIRFRWTAWNHESSEENAVGDAADLRKLLASEKGEGVDRKQEAGE